MDNSLVLLNRPEIFNAKLAERIERLPSARAEPFETATQQVKGWRFPPYGLAGWNLRFVGARSLVLFAPKPEGNARATRRL